MTICDECRKTMKITTALVDFQGKGLREEVEFEYCLRCRIFLVGIPNATVRPA